MKVFFTASQTGKSNLVSNIDVISEFLNKNYVLKTRDYVDFKDTTKDVEKQFIDIYEQTKKNLFQADFVVADATYPTASLGHEITLSIENTKPTIVLVNEKLDINKIPSSIRGNKSKHMILKFYNEKNVTEVLTQAISEAKKLLDSKFILIIPPEIERYLSWASHKKGVRKAEIVRAAVEKAIDLDLDYKKYLTELEND